MILPRIHGREALAAAGDIALSVKRRVDHRSLAAGSVAMVVLIALATFGLTTMAWGAPTLTKLTRLAHTAVASLFVLAAVLVADECVARGTRPLRTYAAAIALGSIVGSLVGFEVRGALGLNWSLYKFGYVGVPVVFGWVRRVDVMLVCAIVGALATHAYVSRRSSLQARRRQHEAEAARVRAQRRMFESELQALQARVEPGFLFDTLDRIHRLYETDARSAGAMLEDLIAYLRAALPHLRESASTLSQEVALACAWLDIMRRSMPALEVHADVAEAARHARLPALVLLPLVQRAVADVPTGTLRVELACRIRDERLRISVATSSGAFNGGAQPVLRPVVERLGALYGATAWLRTETGAAGSRAELDLPFEAASRLPAA